MAAQELAKRAQAGGHPLGVIVVEPLASLLGEPVGPLVYRRASQRKERAAKQQLPIPTLLGDRLHRGETTHERSDEGRERAAALAEAHNTQLDVGARDAGEQGIRNEGHGEDEGVRGAAAGPAVESSRWPCSAQERARRKLDTVVEGVTKCRTPFVTPDRQGQGGF